MKYIPYLFLLTFFASFTSCRIFHPPRKKPIIYLYPTEQMKVNVQLDFKGKLTHTYPKYNPETGWNVIASPNGDLKETSTNKEFYALFWEGDYKLAQPKDGFVVPGEQTAAFLEEKLAILGLSAHEANEFIIYWLPEMENNAYNFIHFAEKSYTESAPLTITPAPETLIRVFMIFQPMKTAKTLPEQVLQPVQRKGFTVVEWGGTELSRLAN